MYRAMGNSGILGRMGNGKLLGKEQRFERRQRNQWANVQDRDYRARMVDPFEVLRRREAVRVQVAQVQQVAAEARRAQEEAEARAERDRLEADALARELYRQDRARITLARKERRDAAKTVKRALTAQQELERKAQEEAQLQQQMAAGQAVADQWGADLETLSDIRANLPILRDRAQAALLRGQKVVRVLTGTPGAHLTNAQNNNASLQQIIARCQAAIAAANLAHQTMMAAKIEVTEAATRIAVVSLQNEINNYVADDLSTTGFLAQTSATEVVYQASLNLATQYPNLNLSHDLVSRNTSPTAILTAQQLTDLNTKLAGHPVVSWIQTNLPASRPLGNIACYIPLQLQNFPYQPGGEIFCDWIFPYQGHGLPARDMKRYLDPIADNSMRVQAGPGFFLNLVRSAGNGGNWVVTMNNSNTRIVFNATMTLLITYFVAN